MVKYQTEIVKEKHKMFYVFQGICYAAALS